MDKTKINWTDRTWNPVTGCTKLSPASPGCQNCYAEGIAERFRGGVAFPNGFDVTLKPDRMHDPLRWRGRGRAFVNSMSDLFHDDVPDDFIAEVFAVMAASPRWTFQVLTKRHGRMRSLLSSTRFQDLLADAVLTKVPSSHRPRHIEWPLPNVWLGVSAENQQWADIRIPALLDCPATTRFVSAEPLLGPVDLSAYLDPEQVAALPTGNSADALQSVRQAAGRAPLDWVIVGGESGSSARPMHPDWARAVRDQCVAAGVAFSFKQWGAWAPVTSNAIGESTGLRGSSARSRKGGYLDRSGAWRDTNELSRLSRPEDWALLGRVGAKAAGRTLDGREWDEFPDHAPS